MSGKNGNQDVHSIEELIQNKLKISEISRVSKIDSVVRRLT
jgi:hypothetical protein